MKKEARKQAETVFLNANGKLSNVEIAKKVGVNPLTVGRWKRADDWTAKLTKKAKKGKEKAVPTPPRKKGAHDQALKLYLESEGRIANTQLASAVGVSPATIAKWKESEGWAPLPAPPVSEAKQTEKIEIDLDGLACPDHITSLNKRIDDMLSQTHLSPTDLKILAEAKEAVLRAVNAYIDVVERLCED